MSAPSKEIGQLKRELRKLGYREQQLASGHFAVLGPDGERLRTHKGAHLTLPATPSDPRALDNIKASLRRAGVKFGASEQRNVNKAVRGQAASLQAAREERKARSHVLREQLKQLMVEHDLRQTDVYHWGEHYCKQHGIATPSNPQTQLSNFLRGGYLLPDSEAYMDATIRSIRAANGKIPRAETIRRREPALSEENGNQPSAAKEVPRDARTGAAPGPVLSESARVVLALRVMRAIYNPVKDDEAIEALCKQVAGLEIG